MLESPLHCQIKEIVEMRKRLPGTGSYATCWKQVAAHTGLEPVISALRGQRVNQLHQCAANDFEIIEVCYWGLQEENMDSDSHHLIAIRAISRTIRSNDFALAEVVG